MGNNQIDKINEINNKHGSTNDTEKPESYWYNVISPIRSKNNESQKDGDNNKK